jgi:hypothetical protein
LIRRGINGFAFDISADWRIEVRQSRCVATSTKPGRLALHRSRNDEFAMIAVLRRHSVTGGEIRLWNPGSAQPFWQGVLTAGQAVLIDDRAVTHDTTDALAANGEPGFWDVLIAVASRWINDDLAMAAT